jgi:hypothetical protein
MVGARQELDPSARYAGTSLVKRGEENEGCDRRVIPPRP